MSWHDPLQTRNCDALRFDCDNNADADKFGEYEGIFVHAGSTHACGKLGERGVLGSHACAINASMMRINAS